MDEIAAEDVRAEFRQPERWRARCSVSRFVTTLTERDAAVFNIALRDPDIRPYELHAWAKARGWEGSDYTLIRHRNGVTGKDGGCACR